MNDQKGGYKVREVVRPVVLKAEHLEQKHKYLLGTL